MTKPVSIQQRIRILDAQGVSWREIARRLGVSRDTVRKYATMEDCSPKPAVRKGRRSLIDAYSGTVDSWLFADRLMPRKQRHTARRVYARLVEEEGFEGSYSSVQRYVKRWREEHRSDGDGYLELDWSAGVMQVDFGEAVATIGGGDVKVHCLVATFPHSNMRYVAAMPGENAECVCEGLAQIFDHIGMVPRVLVLDNATGAGHRVAWNKVTVVRVFAMFCDHYRLETRFCNPYSGNEKGSVENAVGFLRRNLMVPKPNAESHRQLTRHLLSRCDASRTWTTTVPAGRYASCSTRTAGRCSRCRAHVSTRSNGSSARPTRRATSRSARSVTSRARHGAAGRCSRACARSRWRSAPPTAGT